MGASWRSWVQRDDNDDALTGVGNKKKGKGKADESTGGRGDFDILSTKPAPRVTFDKAVKGKGVAKGAGSGAVGKEGAGEEEEVVEKTLLQK